MLAFYRNGEALVKAYDEGDDIRTTVNNAPAYWCSMWAADRRGAILRAIRVTCERNNLALDESHIVFV